MAQRLGGVKMASMANSNTVLFTAYRQSLSASTQQVLLAFDSLETDSIIEFRYIGEGSKPSLKFKNYIQLYKTATDSDLLKILVSPTEHPAIRGYAYMAYAYKCFSKKTKELPLNYSFKLQVINGCIGYKISFADFKTDCKKRNAYNPNTLKTIIPLEKPTNQQENKVRQEQGIPLKKE